MVFKAKCEAWGPEGQGSCSPGQAVGRAMVSVTKNLEIKELRLLVGRGAPVDTSSGE